MVLALSLLLVVGLCRSPTAASSEDPSYDHQTMTYTSTHKPVSCTNKVTATPFFSPDHSIEVYVDLINAASTSIDLYAPGFSSWSGCTQYDTNCVGCSLSDARAEAFPVFPALLNAKHARNVTIRILTNDYGTPTCANEIAPLDWLYLNEIEIKYFTTVTFMHSKVVVVDRGAKTSISSVNFSKTSFLYNREAGVVIDPGCDAVADFVLDVFDADWAQATDYAPTNKYTSSQMSYITNSATLPVVVPPPRHIDNAYVTGLKRFESVSVIDLYTSPDFALAELNRSLGTARTSFQLMIYQVTDDSLCDGLMRLNGSGVDVTLLVSRRIFSEDDWKAAQVCYEKLHKYGLKIQLTPSYYDYSHQKIWIIDSREVHLSTGNWSPTDYPDASSFPPYTSHGWVEANRNFVIAMADNDIVKIFSSLFEEDFSRGEEWTPHY